MELRRRRKNLFKIPILVFFGVLVLGLAIIFGLFHIREADVIGNEFYSAAEIKKLVMNGSLAENSIYLTWKYSDDSAAEDLPFLNGVEVTMINPYHVQIRVYEKTIVGYLMDTASSSRVYFDADGKVVEVSAEERDGVLAFSGVSIGTPVVGEDLPVTDDQFFSSLVKTAGLIYESGLEPVEAHYDDKQNLVLSFGGNCWANLGSSSYMEGKLEQLAMIYPQMEGMSGTLHMEGYAPGSTTFSFVKEERGVDGDEELLTSDQPSSEDGEAETTAGGEGESESESSSESGSGYVEDPSRITTDSSGNQVYTDEQGNTTTNMDMPYLGEDGQIWSDGYGYIDPYTGAYILNQ